jgi:hypothetical protein
VKLIGGDSFYDVAVLAFVDNPGSEITSVQFRDKDIRIGERVYAIGNPLGKYPYTVTDGIISAKNRVRGSLTGKFGFLQTTATLIWGNSGGPLLDSEGKVAGINSQIAFAETPDGEQVLQSQINFALESGISKRIVNDIIINDGRVRRAYVGMEISESYGFEDYAQQTMVLIDKTPVISGVIPGSPALSVGTDILNWHIQRINGIQVRNLEEALGELEKATPRTTITFTLEKNGVTKETSIRSGELKTQELEKIATFVLSQNPDILVDYNHPQVKFRLKSSDKQSYATEKERYRQQMTNNTVAAKNYYILAAGISEDNTKNMWLTENLTKLGAAFRLTGTIGIVDYYVLNADDESQDIEVLRQYLSGDEDIIKSTIWY